MINFIAQSSTNSITDIVLYKYADNNLVYKKNIQLSEIHDEIKEESKLLFLIPSSIISSYPNQNNEDKNSDALFISSIEDNIVEDISELFVKTSKSNGFVIGKDLINYLNTTLSLVKSRIYIYPDYSLFINDGDSIVIHGDSVIFSHDDGTGTSIEKSYAKEYFEIIKKDNKDYEPSLISFESEVDDIFGKVAHKDICSYHLSFLNSHQEYTNLFSFKYSLSSILNKLDFTKTQLGFLSLSLIAIIVIPNLIIANIDRNTQIYKDATSGIFSSLSTKITRVINPRSQIDALIGDTVLINNKQELPNIDFIYRLGGKFVKKIDIDFKSSTALIDIEKMPSMQMSLVLSMGESFGVKIIDQNIIESANGATGTITINFNNE